MTVLIRIIELAGLGAGRTPESGLYLKAMDFDARDGRGHLVVTDDPAEAMPFDTARAAMEFYRTSSKVRPLRPDRRPNRPLTAFTVEIAPAP